MSHQSARRHGRWRPLLAIMASAGFALGLSMVGAAPASAAPSVVITVDTLAFNANSLASSANPSGCANKEVPTKCSLQAALAYANAIPGGAGEIEINFDASLSGLITDSAANTGQMEKSTPSGSTDTNGGYWGFDFVVNASNPVTIDFGGDVGFQSTTDNPYNAFAIRSNNVTITNFTNINAAEAAFLIGDVSGTTISNGSCRQIDSGGNNTNWLESCVVIDSSPGAAPNGVTSNTTIENFSMEDPWLSGIATDVNTVVNGLRVINTSMVNEVNAAHFMQLGYNSTSSNVALYAVSNTVPTGKSASGYSVYIRAESDIDGFTVDQSTFTGMRGGLVNEPGNGTVKDLAVTNSTFNKVGQAWDDLTGPVTNMTWTGNTFTQGTNNGAWWRGAFHMDNGTYTNANISYNQFIDNDWRDSGDIMFQQPGGSNNVIANNTFSRSQAGNDGYENAIRNYVVAASATADTGWRVTNNHFNGYGQNNNAYAPIWHLGRGIMKTTGNTFGANTNGTLNPTESEGGQKWFVANTGGGANNNIQTWRPSNAVFNGSNVTFDVAPVVPVVGGDANKQPVTSPVSLGVFWTADDNAEVYLGQIDGVSAAGSVSIPSTATGGFIRVQTIEADGTSSQYSGIAQVTTSLAAPVITGPTGGSTGAGGTTIAGTGGPGNTVTVTDENDGSTVCTAVVDGSGNWSCTPDTVLSQGVHTLRATQSDGANTSPKSAAVNFTSDGTPLFASPGTAIGASVLLLGGLGGLVLMRRRRVGHAV